MMTDKTKAQCERVIELRKAGKTAVEIAAELGVSTTRVGQIVRRIEQLRQAEATTPSSDPSSNLPPEEMTAHRGAVNA